MAYGDLRIMGDAAVSAAGESSCRMRVGKLLLALGLRARGEIGRRMLDVLWKRCASGVVTHRGGACRFVEGWRVSGCFDVGCGERRGFCDASFAICGKDASPAQADGVESVSGWRGTRDLFSIFKLTDGFCDAGWGASPAGRK